MECVPLGPAPGQRKARLSQQGTVCCWRHSSASWRKPDPEPEPGGHVRLAHALTRLPRTSSTEEPHLFRHTICTFKRQ